MKISREDLTERFRSFSDEELLSRAGSGTLTPLAQEVAEAELRSRGMEPASPAASSDVTDDQAIDLTTVAEFWDPVQAHLLRACLEAHGLFCFVWGEHLATANNFLSAASGGVRLQVRSDQVEEARGVIAAFECGELMIQEGTEPSE